MTTEVKAGSGNVATPLSTPRETTWEGRLVARLTPNTTHSRTQAILRKIALVFLILPLLVAAFARFIARSPNPMRDVKQAVTVLRTSLSFLIERVATTPIPIRSALKGGRLAHALALNRKIIRDSVDRLKARDELIRILDETPSAPPKKVSFKPEVKEKIIEKFNVDERLAVFINPTPLTPAEKAAESDQDTQGRVEARTKITEIARKRYLAYQKIARVTGLSCMNAKTWYQRHYPRLPVPSDL